MISTTDNKKMFNGSGTTGPFTFDFRFFYNTEIHVVKTSTSGVDTELTENVGYTLSGAGSYSGGSVTLSSALASGEKLTIYRDVELVQPVDLRNKGAFFAEIHEDVFDRMTMVGQQLKEQIDRCAKLPITNDTDADELVADILMLANNKAELDVLCANINDIQTVAADLNEPVSEINTVAGSIDNVNTVGGNITNVNTVAGNTTNINTVSGISGNVTTVAGISGNVTTVAGISGNVTTVAGISTNVTAVAGNATNINTVAGDKANIDIVAADKTNIDAVAANKTNIDTVAGNNTNVTTVAGIAGNVTTVAGISANVTAVANNSSNINAVVGNATNINAVNANKANIDTVAGDKANIDAVAGDKANIDAVTYDLTTINAVHANKANIDLVAGDKSNIDAVADDLATINAVHANKTNIDAVAGNNTNITAVAGNATNINLVAGDKANIDSVAGDLTNINAVNANKANIDTVAGISSNVTTVAGISSSVVTAATNVTAINDYSKVWLGGKASDPTLRNDGSALQTGDQYFNTGTNKVRVYSTGTAVWVDSGITFSPTVERFSGTGSQTAFTLSSSPGTAMALIINISGVVQTPTVDYTVSGTTLTFTTAPPSGTNNITVQNFGSAGVINVPADASVSTNSLDGSFLLPVSKGGTGATTAAGALSNLGAQPSATAITTSNIGSQSVSYASSASNADTLDGNHASEFQSTLVSGSNIKTINGTSLLGSGNITAGEATWVANDSRAKTALNSSGTAPIYACRAWVNFNGTGTVAIRASGNVSSITDNGTGNYTVNFTTAMPDANYAATMGWMITSGESRSLALPDGSLPTVNSIQLQYQQGNLLLADKQWLCVSIFR